MKSLTTLALLVGVLSAPALHSEEMPADSLPELNFPLPDAAANSASAPASEANSPATTEAASANADQPDSLPALPPITPVVPDTVPLTPIVGGNLNLMQMGMPDGIILSGGQNQGGASFTLLRSGGHPRPADAGGQGFAGDGVPQRHAAINAQRPAARHLAAGG